MVASEERERTDRYRAIELSRASIEQMEYRAGTLAPRSFSGIKDRETYSGVRISSTIKLSRTCYLDDSKSKGTLSEEHMWYDFLLLRFCVASIDSPFFCMFSYECYLVLSRLIPGRNSSSISLPSYARDSCFIMLYHKCHKRECRLNNITKTQRTSSRHPTKNVASPAARTP